MESGNSPHPLFPCPQHKYVVWDIPHVVKLLLSGWRLHLGNLGVRIDWGLGFGQV